MSCRGEGARGNFEAEGKGGSEAASLGTRRRSDDAGGGVNREVPAENGGAAARREEGSWGKQGVPYATEPEAREVAV